MATDTEQLVLQLSADLRQFQKEMVRAAGEADRAAQRIERRFQQQNQRVVRDFQNFGNNVRNVLAAIGVGMVVRDVVQLGDVWTRVGNRLSFAGVEAGRLATAQETVADIAFRTNSDLESTADLFARMLRSSQDLGASMSEVAAVTEIVSKGLAGASQSERASAIRQLGQGLGSGRLQGDELRSILENSRPIAEAIAAEFETTIGNLRELGKQGELESRRVFQAILRAGDDIDASFNRTALTVEDAFTRLRTASARFIGTNDQTKASVRGLTNLINYVANNFETLAAATVIAATVLGGSFAGLAVGRAVAALSQLNATATLASNTMKFFGGTFGLVLTVAAGALAYFATQTDLFTSSTQAMQRASDSTYAALQKVTSLADDLQTLAEQGDAAADATSDIATAGDDAREALDRLSGSSEDVADRLSIQARLSQTMAIEERRRTVETLRAALADNEAAIALERRQRAIIGIRYAQRSFEMRGPATDQAFASEVAGSEERIRQLEETRDLFRGIISDIEGIDISTWQSLFDIRSAATEETEDGAAAAGRERAELEISHELTLARLRHDEQRVRAITDALEIEKRTKAFVEAGVAAAEALARATEQVTAERQAANAEAQRGYELQQLQDQIELARIANNIALVNVLTDQYDIQRRSRELVDSLALSEEEATARAREYVEARREANDIDREHQLELRTLETQLDIARASGDTRAERAIMRRLELEARISELRRMGVGEEAAADRAAQEVAALERADLRGRFREWFTGGVTAALEGDLDDFFEDWIRDRAAAGLENALNGLADVLFDSFQPALEGLIQSGTSSFATAITGALGDAGGTGIAKLGADAMAAGAILKTAFATSATEAAVQLGLTGAAAVSSAARETAASATKNAASASVTSASIVLAKSLFAAATAAQAFAAGAGGGGKGNIISSVTSVLGSIFKFGGGKAAGGPVQPGYWYNVGERGPETFVPQVPGFIIPNGGFGGKSSTNVTYVDRSVYHVTGASTAEVQQIKQELRADQAARRETTVSIIRDAISRRQLTG